MIVRPDNWVMFACAARSQETVPTTASRREQIPTTPSGIVIASRAAVAWTTFCPSSFELSYRGLPGRRTSGGWNIDHGKCVHRPLLCRHGRGTTHSANSASLLIDNFEV